MGMQAFKDQLYKYATLALEVGLGFLPGQRLVISADVESAEFVRIASEVAYRMGAKYVSVFWDDEQVRRSRLLYSSRENLSEIHEWRAQAMLEVSEAGDAVLAVFSQDPQIFEDIDSQLVQLERQALDARTGLFWQRLGSNKFNWSAILLPSQAWANRIFPNDPQAFEKFWKATAQVVMLDTPDPVAAWRKNCQELQNRQDYLNNKRFKALRYRAPGTKLEIGLATDHNWQGGAKQNANGSLYVANIPTYEVFTAPHREQVNGTVRGTKPRIILGTLVEDWSLTFENGKVVDATARVGLSALEHYLNLEGTRYLGEVALVPSGTPVDQTNLIFLNALVDENAASHIALGSAYRYTMIGGEDMSDEEFMAKGGNISHEHNDIMIGSSEMDIDGVLANGNVEPLMRAGQFVFEQPAAQENV
jgi:aminopeptidase